MPRILVVPAAGLGTRLRARQPKALVQVNGRPMLDHLLDLYARHVDTMVVVAHPSFASALDAWRGRAGRCEIVQQSSPTGMLDAIRCAAPAVARLRPDWIWITWCDQVGVLPSTVERLADVTGNEPAPALAFPTVCRAHPYIHFARHSSGRITGVLHQREGDAMPAVGESDIGVFALSRAAFERDLPAYESSAEPGRTTGERNFLPFIPWLASRASVVTFPCTDPMEAIGINTPEELRQVEEWLRQRGAP